MPSTLQMLQGNFILPWYLRPDKREIDLEFDIHVGWVHCMPSTLQMLQGSFILPWYLRPDKLGLSLSLFQIRLSPSKLCIILCYPMIQVSVSVVMLLICYSWVVNACISFLACRGGRKTARFNEHPSTGT